MAQSAYLLNNILNSECCSSFLNTGEDSLECNQQNTNETEKALQTINSLLTNKNSVDDGIELLRAFLPQCSQDIFEQKANFWSGQILKASNFLQGNINLSLLYNVVETILIRCHQSSELSKLFSTKHLVKIFESLSLLSLSNQPMALKCVKKCLELYPTASGQSLSLIERYLSNNSEATDQKAINLVGVCQLLLQQVKCGATNGISLKTQWTNYHLNLIIDLDSTIDQICYDNPPILGTNNSVNNAIKGKNILTEHTNILRKLVIHFHNVTYYLILALRSPFPSPKCVAVKKILNLIHHGLTFNINQSEQRGTLGKNVISAIAPKIHFDLLELLNALIATLGCHLKVYSSQILDMLTDTLNLISLSCPESKIHGIVRIKVYNILTLWCDTMQHGSYCEYEAERLIAEIFRDIYPKKQDIILEVQSGARKNLTKKIRRLLNKTQNIQSKIGRSHCNQRNSMRILYDEHNGGLCNAALECLQSIMLSSAFFVKPEVIKSTNIKLLQICLLFNELPMDRNNFYFSAKCRIAIYNNLKAVLLSKHYLAAPPVDAIHIILKNAHNTDKNILVRNKCSNILRDFEHILRPQKEGLEFCIPNNEIQNKVTEAEQLISLSDSEVSLGNNMYHCKKIETKTISADNNINVRNNTVKDTSRNCLHSAQIMEVLESSESPSYASNIVLKTNVSREMDDEPVMKKLKTPNVYEMTKEMQINLTDEDLITEIESTFVDELA